MVRSWYVFLVCAIGVGLFCTGVSQGFAQNQPGRPQANGLTGVVPNRVAQGTIGTVLRMLGSGFEPGMTIEGSKDLPPDLIYFSPVRVISSTLAITTVTVARNTPPGSYSFLLRQLDNQDLPTVVGSFNLQVFAGSSLAAPVGVTTVAVVHPQEGTPVGEGERVFPRAVLAVTGSGTITGFWELDGVAFDRFVVSARGGYPVEVKSRVSVPQSSRGSHRLTLRIDSPQVMTSDPIQLVLISPQAPLLRLVTPRPGSVSSADEEGGGPVFRWTHQPGAFAYEVLISEQPFEAPNTSKHRTRESPWRLPPDERAKLGTDQYWWSVRPVFAGGVAGKPADWRSVELVAETAGGSDPPPEAKSNGKAASPLGFRLNGPSSYRHLSTPFHGPWNGLSPGSSNLQETSLPILDVQLDVEGNFTWIPGDELGNEDEARLIGSGSVYRERTGHSLNGSASLSLLHRQGSDGFLEQESRSYLFNGWAGGGPWGVLGSVGYFGPATVSDSSFMNAGLTRGGAELGAQTPAGSFQFYGTYDHDPAGLTSVTLGTGQEIKSVSYSLPSFENVERIKLMVLDVTDLGSEELAIPRTQSRSFGIQGGFRLAEQWQLGLEAAGSDMEDFGDALGFAGKAFRFDLTGQSGNTGLSLGFGKTDSGFVNLASGALVEGGVPDRTNMTFSLSNMFGQSSLNVGYNYTASGASDGGVVAAAQQHAFQAMVASLLTPVVQLSIDGSYTMDHADETTEIPEVELKSFIASAMLTEVWGAMSASQSFSLQMNRNGGPPEASASDLDVQNAMFSADGGLGEHWSISASATWTRSKPKLGEPMDTTMFSVQPTWMHTEAGVTISPWFAVTLTDVPEVAQQRATQLQAVGSWNFFAGEQHTLGLSFSAGWNETLIPEILSEPETRLTDTTFSATFTWHWGYSSAVARAGAAAVADRLNPFRLLHRAWDILGSAQGIGTRGAVHPTLMERSQSDL